MWKQEFSRDLLKFGFRHCRRLNLDGKIAAERGKMFDPFASGGIAAGCLRDPIRIGVLQYLVVIVLSSPDVHLKGQAPSETSGSFQLFHQIDVVGILEASLG